VQRLTAEIAKVSEEEIREYKAWWTQQSDSVEERDVTESKQHERGSDENK